MGRGLLLEYFDYMPPWFNVRLTNYIHNDFVIRKSINVAGHVPQQMPVSVGTSYAAVICIFSGNVRQSLSFVLQVTNIWGGGL